MDKKDFIEYNLLLEDKDIINNNLRQMSLF